MEMLTTREILDARLEVRVSWATECEVDLADPDGNKVCVCTCLGR